MPEVVREVGGGAGACGTCRRSGIIGSSIRKRMAWWIL